MAFQGGGSQGFGNFDFGSSFSDIFEDFFGDDILVPDEGRQEDHPTEGVI